MHFCSSSSGSSQHFLLLAGSALAASAAPLAAQAPVIEQPTTDNTSAAENVDESEQQRDTADASDSSSVTRRTFQPEEFDRFAPRSALDIARQIPGFAIREGDGARGLGQADTNVLINGRRISGKSNGPVAALQRIPVEEVVRLELVDGASLEIGGLTGQVLNVITSSSGGISGQFRYAPQFRSFGTPFRWGNARVAIAGGGDKTEWTLALENDQGRFGDEGPELVFDGAGDLIDTREEFRNEDVDLLNLSGSFTRVADNGNVLNLTGEVNGFIFRFDEISERSGSISPVDRVRDFRETEDEYNFELGADYEFKLGPGRLKLIGYHRYEDSPTTSQATIEFADGSPPTGSLFTRDADEAETIIRTEYGFPALGGDLLVALEGVSNFLDIISTLEERDAEGVLQPVEFPGASARVEEDRADFGVTYNRALSPKLQLQVSLGGEYSQLRQSGELGQTRDFVRPKGFVALDWNANSKLNLSGRIEREVGQLNFFDFIASANLNQDRVDVTNADLVPQQSWVFEVEANLDLGALGSLNLRPFYEEISDIVDQIPIEGGGQAPGNLPSAQFYGIESELTLLSEPLGWQGTRLDVSLSLRGSSVRDPLLGTTRELSGNDIIDLESSIRHDFFGTDFAIGGEANWEDNAENVRLDEIALRTESFGFVSAFVEHKDIAGLTFRANIANLVDRRNRFSRTVFLDRANDVIDFSETRSRRLGTIFTLEIEGSF